MYKVIINSHLFKRFFSRTTWVSWHQKDKTILDFNKARDDRVAVASAGPHANHLPCSRQVTIPAPHHSNFLQAGCFSWCPTNSVKTLKAIRCWFVGLSTPPSSLKDMNIAQQIVAIYPQPSAGCKPKPTVNFKKNYSYVCAAYHCVQLSHRLQHTTVLIIFRLILQTVIIAQILSVGVQGHGYNNQQ